MAPTGIIGCDRRERNGEELAVNRGDRKGRDSRRQRLKQQATDAQTASDRGSDGKRQRLRQQAAEAKTAADHQGDMTTAQVVRLLTISKY